MNNLKNFIKFFFFFFFGAPFWQNALNIFFSFILIVCKHQILNFFFFQKN